MWLPVQGTLPPRLFSLLVLLPKREAPDGLPYVYLGAQFLLEYRAWPLVNCSAGTPTGSQAEMVIP
jgi:hypothetical protein